MELKVGKRVHRVGETKRVGTVKYIGHVDSQQGVWIGVDWDHTFSKNDGSFNGLSYFIASSPTSGSFLRPNSISLGVSLFQAFLLKYFYYSSSLDLDEMYVLSSTKKRISVKLLVKDESEEMRNHCEDLKVASLPFYGIGNYDFSSDIGSIAPNLKELDLTGNLLSEWSDIAAICQELPTLDILDLSKNRMTHDIVRLPRISNIRVLVLNQTGLKWEQVEILKGSFLKVEELHLMGNNIHTITPISSRFVEGFDSLRILNMEDNKLVEWDEILKLSHLKSIQQLHLNKNCFKCITFPESATFQNLHCLLLGNNYIGDMTSIDALNFYPKLIDVRLSDNPATDPGRGGVPRFVLVARLSNIRMLNGSEVTPYERKDSEIRYVHMIMERYQNREEEAINTLHPRFSELKQLHGIEHRTADSKSKSHPKTASGFIYINFKCFIASTDDKSTAVKRLPATTTIGRLHLLCERFFRLDDIKLKLFLQEEGTPLQTLLDDETLTMVNAGVVNNSTILVYEEG